MMICPRHERVRVPENLCLCKSDYIQCYKCHLEAYHLHPTDTTDTKDNKPPTSPPDTFISSKRDDIPCQMDEPLT